jgi:ATP-dependent RNA helicase DDX46/PRP5
MADLDKSDKKPDEKKVEEQEDVDPLDAYMAELDKTKSKDAQAKKARVVELDTNKQEDDQQKGEIIENEDEAGPLVDDFDMEQAASSLMSKGRQLAQTNHEMVYYRPFRRNFYIEVPELQKMSKKEVEKYREELDEIKVRGLKCPKPIKNWAQAGVELKVLNTLKK